MQRRFASDRCWDFDESPDHLWSEIAAVERYRSWWPWLRSFEPGEGLVHQASWCCEVAPPLPYSVRFTVELDLVEPGSRAEATVSGDVVGTATLTLDELAGGGTRARLVSTLAPANPVLRAAGAVAAPMVRWGHDWVLEQGREQFVRNALR